jgi:hypothetical protein
MTPYTRRKRTLKARVRRQKTEENVGALRDHVCMHGNPRSSKSPGEQKVLHHLTVRDVDNIRWRKPEAAATAPS